MNYQLLPVFFKQYTTVWKCPSTFANYLLIPAVAIAADCRQMTECSNKWSADTPQCRKQRKQKHQHIWYCQKENFYNYQWDWQFATDILPYSILPKTIISENSGTAPKPLAMVIKEAGNKHTSGGAEFPIRHISEIICGKKACLSVEKLRCLIHIDNSNFSGCIPRYIIYCK